MDNSHWFVHSDNGLSHIGNCHGVEGWAQKQFGLQQEVELELDMDMDMEEGKRNEKVEEGDNLKGLSVRLNIGVVGMQVRMNMKGCTDMDVYMDLDLDMEQVEVDMDLNLKVGIDQKEEEGIHILNFGTSMKMKNHNYPYL